MFSFFVTYLLASANSPQYLDEQCDPGLSGYCGDHQHQHVSDPLRSCTEGFEYDDLEKCCIMETRYSPLLRCPFGGRPLEDGNCHCESEALLGCPDGFKYDNVSDSCINTILSPMIPSCAHRPELDGELAIDGRYCTYYKEMPVRHSCPQGTKIRGDHCVDKVSVPDNEMMFGCPDGWQLDEMDRECVLVERVKCDCGWNKKNLCGNTKGQHWKKRCPFEQYSSCGSDCMIQPRERRLCEDCATVASPDVVCQATNCKMAIETRKQHQHHKKEDKTFVNKQSHVVATECERITVMNARPICARGSYHQARGCCVEELTFPASAVCNGQNVLRNGYCFKPMKFLSDHVCPSPFEVSCGGSRGKKSKMAHPATCECVSLQYADASSFCPPESAMSNDGYCVQIVPPVLYCAESDAVVVDGLCYRIEKEPARLEYTVTYITEEPCISDDCTRRGVTLKRRQVKHREVHMDKGKARTVCHERNCVNKEGMPIVESRGH